VKQPCLDCGIPTDGSRCRQHTVRHERQRQRTQTLKRMVGGAAPRPYGGDYRQRAAEVRATTSICWLCGEAWRPDDPWQADHVEPGNVYSQLRGAHRSCNIGRANKGRAKRGDL